MLNAQADTICAVATPTGEGAISVIRVSGTGALACVKKIAKFLPRNPETHRVYYGHLQPVAVTDGSADVLDEVLVTYFAQGKSFTAEEALEISCHGSPAIVSSILQQLIIAGARLAQKGEFTLRAFLNGRIDLVQAEGVLALIQSQSAISARLALRQLKGGLSREIGQIEEKLSWILSRLEANIDFSAEDIEFAPQSQITDQMTEVLASVQQLISTYQAGRILRSELRVALIGAPNVGKSSLLNVLAQQDRAIVSPIAGTTRDAIEVCVELSGQKVILVDTAGIRVSTDEVESLGIQRTFAEVEEADVILFLYDVSSPDSRKELSKLKPTTKPLLIVGNKVDIVSDASADNQDIYVSATKNFGIENLKDKISSHMQQNLFDSATVLLSTRHYELLKKMENSISAGLDLQKKSLSPEFIIAELQEALTLCFELLGRRFDDEILDRVFSDFCLGK